MQFAFAGRQIKNRRKMVRYASEKRGSITVEAALAVPIFLFAAVCLLWLFEIRGIQTTVRMAAHAAAKQTAEESLLLPELQSVMFRSHLIRAAGEGRLDRTLIEGGSRGIKCGKTRFNQIGQLQVCVEYRVKLPMTFLGISPMKMKEEFLLKSWTGYETFGEQSAADGEIVYITDWASVYHEAYDCTHLQLTVQAVPRKELGSYRNESGGKYHACEKCGKYPSMGNCYITDQGDKYHNSVSCSGLKRTIYAVTKEEVKGKRGCSKCTH